MKYFKYITKYYYHSEAHIAVTTYENQTEQMFAISPHVHYEHMFAVSYLHGLFHAQHGASPIRVSVFVQRRKTKCSGLALNNSHHYKKVIRPRATTPALRQSEEEREEMYLPKSGGLNISVRVTCWLEE